MTPGSSSPIRIIVFAKAPEPGMAKTRLIPALGPGGAARLAEAMLWHTLDAALACGADVVELCVAPGVDHVFWQAAGLPDAVQLSSQGDGDLGARMWRAASRALGRGEFVVLIGTDCPALDGAHLRAAAQALREHDVVIHPALDGGYTLMGLSRPAANLFQGIEWSTERVAAQTRARIADGQFDALWLQELPDVDEPADLQHLPPALREVIEPFS